MSSKTERRFVSRHTLAFAPLLAMGCIMAAHADPASSAFLAYYENDGGASSNALHERNAYFNQIATDSFAVDSRGKVSGDLPTTDLRFAKSIGVQRFAVVSNFSGSDFSERIAHAVVASPKATKAMTDGMLAVLASGGYTGINIDFEAVDHKDRKAFSAFIDSVAQAARAKGYTVVVSVPAKTTDDPGDDWTGGFDFAAIGRSADVVQLMTYDENGSWGDPGPVAGLDWVEASVKYAVSVVPSSKVSLGVAAYGYDWDLTDSTKNVQVPWTSIAPTLQATGALAQWDAPTSSPYFEYTADNHKHVVWYESARSVATKSALVGKYQLNGVSVYALGMEDQDFWEAVHSPPP